MCCSTDPQNDLKGCHQVLRWLMFVINTLLFIGAAVLLAYGCYMINSKWTLLSHSDNIIPVVMFITFGVIMLVTTLGSLGACNLSRGFLIAYAVVTILCLILEIVLISLLASDSMDKTTFLETRWNDLSTNDQQWIESEFNCCGLNAMNCDHNCDSTCNATTNEPTTTSLTYCENQIKDYVHSIEDVALGIGIAILIFELGGVIISIILVRALKFGDRVREDSYIEYSYYNNL